MPFHAGTGRGQDRTGRGAEVAGRHAGEMALAQFEEAAALIASELLTNAIAQIDKAEWVAARPPVRLWLHGGPSLVALLAWDPIVTAPVPREAADDEESGRGLFLVGQYSTGWGFYCTEELGGKVTWAMIGTQ